jgi:type VI secretion system protein ImpL
MLTVLKSRAFLIAVGLVLLAFLIWFVGPYFAFADYKPLDSVVARLIAILCLAVIYAVVVQLRQMRNARASRQIADGVAKQDDTGSADGAASPEAAQLRKRFEEAIEALKKSKKKGAANLYELPWYIIIGPPGSGKTTVLVNSGLNFPLAQKFGKEALRGVGGTRNCDWWFTDEAILLDTAGRYTTQDSNARADAAGWGEFLQLLRKFRGRQPINGVIIALSATDLLTLRDAEREQHVAALRARLDELGRHLKIEAPVYFLVTKCDLIAGFSEFFDDLGQEGRSQVWGVTFPIEATEAGSAPESFGPELERLLERLQSRVIPRMEGERDPRRRVGILAFPQQMAALKPLLSDLLRGVFSASGFDSRVLLRGVYFTSGTQEGTPIDRMLGAIARTFGFTSAVAPPPAGRGKAYFIERLLRDVLFRESGLAGVNRRAQLQKILLQSSAYIVCVAVLVLGALALFVSYHSNANYVDEVSLATRGLDSTQAAATAPGAPPEAFLPALDTVRDITSVAEKFQGGAPFSMRMGLFRGGALGAAAREAYSRELNATVLPLLRASFERDLRSNGGTPDQLYEHLKGYLMLGDARHRNADFLRYLGQSEWRRLYPSDGVTAQRLSEHFEQLLGSGQLQSVTANPQIVEEARTALRNASIPVLMYSRLRLKYLQDTKRAVRLDVAAGSGASEVLVRRSGKPLSDPVPALYTRAVFNEINRTGKYELMKDFAEDAWVFGDNALDLRNGGALLYQVLGVYETDYIRAWDEILKDVTLKQTAGAQEFASMLGTISSPASPLKGFLNTVASNTNLLEPDTSTAGKVAGALDARLEGLKKVMGQDPVGAAKPGERVAAHFEPIRRLVDGPPGQAPVDLMLAKLNQQAQLLQSTGSGVGQRSAGDPAVQAAVSDAKRTLDQISKELPAPLGSLVSQVAMRSESIVTTEARGELARRYAEQVVRECHDLVEGRYPINPRAESDVALSDFGRVFGPSGVFDAFFRDNLAALVDTSGTQWQWRAGAASGPPSMLQQFQRVQHIRELYFKPGAQTPEARFTLLADTLDASVVRFKLDVDGQPFEYRHGPVQTQAMSWPGSTGQASFGFEDRSGPIPGVAQQGPWAFFKVLDQSQIERISDLRYRVTFSAGGKSMRAILEAASIRNPFGRNELSGFRCTM